MSKNTINIPKYTDYSADFEANTSSEFDSIEQATQFVIEHQDHYPAVKTLVMENDTQTVAEFISLVPEYVNGNVTYRSVGKTVGVPYKHAFNALATLMRILVDETPDPQTFSPDKN